MLDSIITEASNLFDQIEVEDAISGDTSELVQLLEAVGVTTNVKNVSVAINSMNHTSDLLNKSQCLNLVRHVQPISDDKDFFDTSSIFVGRIHVTSGHPFVTSSQ